MFTNKSQTDHILRLEEVKAFTRKSKSALYADINRGLFPPPFKIGLRAVGWKQSQLSTWFDNLSPSND
jgi:prophage regulatory protein